MVLSFLYKLVPAINFEDVTKLASKNWFQFVSNLQRYDTIFSHVPKRVLQLASEKLQYI